MANFVPKLTLFMCLSLFFSLSLPLPQHLQRQETIKDSFSFGNRRNNGSSISNKPTNYSSMCVSILMVIVYGNEIGYILLYNTSAADFLCIFLQPKINLKDTRCNYKYFPSQHSHIVPYSTLYELVWYNVSAMYCHVYGRPYRYLRFCLRSPIGYHILIFIHANNNSNNDNNKYHRASSNGN